ncbi:MAG TPA: hypothetical protein VE035_17125 [Puia sp.]|nr:hypothetical protein [Puia sp.]
MEDNPLTEQESLELITRMINKTKHDYLDTGVSALLWGSVISISSLLSFASYYQNWGWGEWVWWLTYLAVIPQIIISWRDKKKRKYRTYSEDAMGGIWISFGISMFLLSYYNSLFHIPHAGAVFLVIYGVPTFATGFTRSFRPMIIGGIACWILAILSMRTPFPYSMLYNFIAAQLAWFIPGLILRRRYLKAKKQHV